MYHPVFWVDKIVFLVDPSIAHNIIEVYFHMSQWFLYKRKQFEELLTKIRTEDKKNTKDNTFDRKIKALRLLITWKHIFSFKGGFSSVNWNSSFQRGSRVFLIIWLIQIEHEPPDKQKHLQPQWPYLICYKPTCAWHRLLSEIFFWAQFESKIQHSYVHKHVPYVHTMER